MKTLLMFVGIVCAGCIGRSEADPVPVQTRATQPTAGQPQTAPSEPAGGSITGRVTWRGARPPMAPLPTTANTTGCPPNVPFEALEIGGDNGVSNTIITVVGAHGTVQPAHVTFDQRGCVFQPHVAAVPVGSRLTFTSHDSMLHTVHAFRGPATEFNLATPPGVTLTREVREPGLLTINCDTHPWMRTYVQVVDSPFVATTSAHGAYTIDHVPPGSYTITAWHEGWQPRPPVAGHVTYSEPVVQTRHVTVPANGPATVDFTLGG